MPAWGWSVCCACSGGASPTLAGGRRRDAGHLRRDLRGVLRPRITPSLAYYWRPRYLPGNEPNALSFLHVQLQQLTPYLAISGRFGIGVDLIVGVLAALGFAALAWMGRFALAGLLPVTLAVTIVASAARIYPFGDQRTSTFWLVMVPVLIAIGRGRHPRRFLWDHADRRRGCRL